MKRLAIITTHPIQYYAPMFNLLSRRGNIHVKVYYTIPQGKTDFDKDFGQTVKWDIPLLEGYEYAFVAAGLNKAIEEWGADAILVIGWNHWVHMKAMWHFSKRKTVLFRGDSTLLDELPGWRKIARKTVLRRVYRYVDKALYVGINNKQYYIEYGLKPHQLEFAPHAIDNQRFYDPEGDYSRKAAEWRRDLGIDPATFVFLFVAKLQPEKDPLTLIRAFRRLDPKKAILLIVGSGVLEETLKQEAAGDERILFLPFQNQSSMPIVYRLGEVFCLPSQTETWGLAVNEAMACERPVLVSDRCGCAPDLVIPGKNGFIFEAGNVDDLTAKMQPFLGDPAIGRQMGAESVSLIRQWSFDRIASAIEASITAENE
ncbi:glycosyltransferase family 4 protein [Puia dinghuensis]|uniref:Hexosyltransferase n=1 Tax=Puia dinghuensis TaxID=1792502 RepID=A0A8J2UEX4_9BACT|nr:glycosyltransferase family 4 protein [Puia dinghuensis]GGB08462.1 hexosyltransferase [Puia dinghuensis]